MFVEPKQISDIRTLISNQNRDYRWYEQVSAILEINEDCLNDYYLLLNYWKDSWGIIDSDTYKGQAALTWHREDGGPQITDITNTPKNEKLAVFLLKAKLIAEINKANQLSFVKFGFPAGLWRRAMVYLDDKPLSDVNWACSITGVCFVAERNEHGVFVIDKDTEMVQTKRLIGRIVITLFPEDLSFF